LINGLRHYEAAGQIKLSGREIEVLELVMEGLSTAEIADKLFISPRTVETHRSNLLSKTESKNTAQLIKYAQEKGLLRMKPVK
ncbi:MAG TPA: helix-turn-helix transcriptional regulator, partial [Bacteroidia bacterium]|nr:helix-turn-helix transcriptional regulator [Bacteroidia bacterium]